MFHSKLFLRAEKIILQHPNPFSTKLVPSRFKRENVFETRKTRFKHVATRLFPPWLSRQSYPRWCYSCSWEPVLVRVHKTIIWQPNLPPRDEPGSTTLPFSFISGILPPFLKRFGKCWSCVFLGSNDVAIVWRICNSLLRASPSTARRSTAPARVRARLGATAG